MYAGGVDKRVYELDMMTGRRQLIGTDHQMAVSGLVYHAGTGSVISGSWDKRLHVTDPRSGETTSQIDLPGKVFALDAVGHKVVAAMSDRRVWVWDARNMSRPLQKRDSSLKYQTKSLRCMADGRGYANTSIEGRVAVEFFDESPAAQEQLFVFKCHRIRGDAAAGEPDTVTPVNAVAWHPRDSTFATAGSDSNVVLWDARAKKRVKQFSRLPYSAVAVDIDPTGQFLAVGASDDAYVSRPHELAKQPIRSAIFVRDLSDVNESRRR